MFCKHEDLLNRSINDIPAGVTYLEGMLFRCDECSAGIWVRYDVLSKAMDGFTETTKNIELFDRMGVYLWSKDRT